MSGVKKKLSGSQKRKLRKEKEYNINSKYAKLDNFLISASSSSCASASSSNARELDEQSQAHPGIHKRRIWKSGMEIVMEVVRDSTDDCPRRLKARVKSKGGHFE
ncbi:hypothetical protein TNCV_3987131 [Trichonephila clavipes]|nr:hypothetical protein TNCV_3987131 [Trichonephila clavipes]